MHELLLSEIHARKLASNMLATVWSSHAKACFLFPGGCEPILHASVLIMRKEFIVWPSADIGEPFISAEQAFKSLASVKYQAITSGLIVLKVVGIDV